jgi:DNA polymerase-1
MKKGDHLFLVDGSGYIFRAYHALPPLNRKSDGLPTSAVLGFCNMVWKLIQDARNTDIGITPTHFAVIFDYSSKTFRNDLYPGYKANRSAPPEDLIPQFGLIRHATRAFDLPCIEMEGFEADDLIATYARLACEAEADTTIISSDKDLMQLVGPTVSMYDPMKDREIRIPEVVEKWGVPPEKMIDLQALTGDSVDNVPGVPGIGPKTAAQLLEQFGDLDTLLARASEIKQEKRRESIIGNADKARISRELVRLKNDVPVTEGLDALALQPPNGPKLIAFLKTMEFSTLTRRVAEATGTEAAEVEAALVPVETGAEAHGPDVGAGMIALEAEVELAPAPAADRQSRRRRQPLPLAARPRKEHRPCSPHNVPRQRWRPGSTPTPMRRSATCRPCRPGSGKAWRPASWPSMPRRRRLIPCRRSCAASPSRSGPDGRPMCRSRIGPAVATCWAAG